MSTYSIDEYFNFINRHLTVSETDFYVTENHFALGRGLIYDQVRYPLYLPDERKFRTVEGRVYVLTHECDADQSNIRPYNDDILICPLLQFEIWVCDFHQRYGRDKCLSWLANMGKRKISRLFYFPKIDDRFRFGAVAFLNQMYSTKINEFVEDRAQLVSSLSSDGLEDIQTVLRTHFFRPKVDVASSATH
jgi:hypothetical protein